MSTVHQIHRRQQIDARLADCADEFPYLGDNEADLWRGMAERDMLRRGRKDGPPILPEPRIVPTGRVRRSWVGVIGWAIVIGAALVAITLGLLSAFGERHVVQRQAVEVRA